MIYLVLAVGTQVLMANLLKIGELYRQDRLVMMGFNYVFAALIASTAWAFQGTGLPSTATLVLGPVGGFFYAAGLFLWMGAISRAGVGVSTAAMRLSVLWPTLLSVLAFGEVPGPAQLLGVALTFVVLALLATHGVQQGRERPGQGAFVLLAATFVLNGGVGITQKLFTEWAPPSEKIALLALVYAAATAMCGARMLWTRRAMRRGDVLRGFLFGAGNVLSNTFLLMGLERVPGVVAFPFSSVGIILFTALGGILVWRERPGLLGTAAIALAAVAIVLMTR